MGGYNSGRYGGRPTIEATASYWLQASILNGVSGGFRGRRSGSITFGDGFSVEATLDTTNIEEPYLDLRHAIRAEDEREISYRVYFNVTKPHFGGRRLWWICPRSNRRVFKLYLPLGGWRFQAREAYGLAYACQRETKADRRMRKARKLHRRLGGDGQGIGTYQPDKPLWMRWRTYEQLVERWVEADLEADGLWAAAACRRFGFLPR